MRFQCYKSKPFVVNMHPRYNLTVTRFGRERVTHQKFITRLTQVYLKVEPLKGIFMTSKV